MDSPNGALKASVDAGEDLIREAQHELERSHPINIPIRFSSLETRSGSCSTYFALDCKCRSDLIVAFP